MKKFILYALFLMVFIPLPGYAQEDLFQVKTPNVMIIFDTSSSMGKKPDGADANSGNVCVDTFGRIQTTNGGAPPCDSGYTVYNFEGGANHPSSKLYLAKLALKEIMEDVVKDKVNLGFSTYAQVKTEIRRGYYWRNRHYYRQTWYRWDKRYWKFYWDRHSWSVKSKEPNSFKDYNNTTHTGVSVGYEFFIPHTTTNSLNNNGVNEPPPFPPGTYSANMRHTVYSITYNAEYNEYTFSYRTDWHEHYSIVWKSKWYATSGPIVCTAEFPLNWGDGYITYWPGDANYDADPTYWECKGPFTETGWDYWAKEWTWIQFNSATCSAEYGSDNLGDPNPNNQYSRWYLAGPPDFPTPNGAVNATGMTCYEYSDYKYLTTLGPSRPHIWSYFKTVGNCPPGDPGCNYQWSIQSQPGDFFYPSDDDLNNVNNNPGTFNNHWFFINFPDDKDVGFNPAIRSAIKDQVITFLDLTPVMSPESGRYWTKLPLHSNYAKTGMTSNTAESFHTPLADSLKSAQLYFYDYIYNYNGGDPPSQATAQGVQCRGNYVILLTDGLESARCLPSGTLCPSGGGGTPDYSGGPTEAANLLATNVKTFVIGFGTDVQGNQTLNNIASSGGTYQAYFATDLASLKDALKAIFQAIVGSTYGRSNPVMTKSGDRIFKGFFDITADNSWKGHLWTYDINQSSGEVVQPYAWDGGARNTLFGRGTIWTWKDDLLNPSKEEFQINNSNLWPLVYPSPRNEDINGDGDKDDEDAQTIIGYTLDPNFDDRTVGGVHAPPFHKGYRPVELSVGWKLGDIYHSTPVVIGSPPFFTNENNYITFYQNYKNRTQMVYVGANDGMLHGFKNTKTAPLTDGREQVAILPIHPSLTDKPHLGKVRKLNSEHGYYVDGSPKAYDVYFRTLNPPEDWQKWRTVIITGQRDGGPFYFAVDVTNPDGYGFGPQYPRILWHWTESKLGDAWAKPDIGKVNDGGTIKYVAFITGGYSPANNKGNAFYIVDIETGTTLKSFESIGNPTNDIPCSPIAFDANGDGLVDYIYFGDTDGTMWRVDVRDPNKANWVCIPLFTPTGGQRKPIFYSPAVAKNDEGKILVFFGTGEELNLLTNTDNYFWEIWDDNGTGRIIPGSSWPKVLTGQKILSTPVVANYVVYFTSWLYTLSSEFCGAGEGRLYGLKISNGTTLGGVAGLVTLDEYGNPQPVSEYVSLGAGIPGSPVVTNGNIYVSSSVSAKDIIRIRFKGWPTSRTKSWREVF